MVEALIPKKEIVSESEAQELIRQGKGNYINYQTYVELDDKITISHYDEKSNELPLVKPVSGVNKGAVENNDHKNTGGGVITHSEEKENSSLDNDFWLKYFQEKDIKQITLTPKGNLLIEYNNGKSKMITNSQVQQSEFQKVISYCQKNNQTNLSQQDLINMRSNSNSPTTSSKNNIILLVTLGISGVLIIGIIVGLWLRKNKVRKH
ncbi:3664_t:CDS:2 [Funneliformis geosporum]|uniref:2770_t:CDS:1 n=1 Tax=Funneliformis geosporum TaxID=1117311 RepID=A0A9W4SXF9_9GLOM|nr:2770_t:CDS:2 [Funneliformis geosporum]CAI2186239.1 3664_t:CDS:2 [Funneliformis geosporum]